MEYYENRGSGLASTDYFNIEIPAVPGVLGLNVCFQDGAPLSILDYIKYLDYQDVMSTIRMEY